VFSAANEPAWVGAALAALRILRSEPERMQRARENGELLRRALAEAGATPVPGRGAVLAVPTGEEEVTAAAWKAAFDAGVYANAVAYPAVPRGQGVLRLSVMATHTEDQLRTAAGVIGAAVAAARASVPPQAIDSAVA
jgi:8-amino-7-oxononanoate synthase